MAVDHNNPQSRDEEILIATIDGTEYDKLPQSRMEELLLELKDVIESGSGGGSVHFVVVEELPTTDIDQSAIYLVPKSTAATSNVYDEYINTDGTTSGWELIGTTDIDLSDYITDDDLATVLEDYATTQDLSGKQDTLTAGKYINIDANNEIKVNPVVPNEAFTYTIKQIDDYSLEIIKTVNDAVVFDEVYSCYDPVAQQQMDVNETFDDAINIHIFPAGERSYTLLIASDAHEAGFKQTTPWYQRNTFVETFSTVDHTGEKLVIKSELDTALTSKQDKTDNNLTTTDKTTTGAINELKSGLTNVQDDVNLNTNDLTTPSRTKNLLLIDLPTIKAFNEQGTWDGNSYTRADVTYTLNFDGNGNLANVTVNGTASADGSLKLVLQKDLPLKAGSQYIVSGSTGGSANTYAIDCQAFAASQDGDSEPFTYNTSYPDYYILIVVKSGVSLNNKVFYPMVRIASDTDPTFAPYIPSVESRIEAVESDLIKVYEVPYSDFTWDADQKRFYCTPSGAPSQNRVVGSSVMPTNGAAIMGLYIHAQGVYYVTGFTPVDGQSISSGYIFKCFVYYI